MRPLRVAILLLLIAVGQVHACSATWVLPDGSKCSTCPTLPCAPQATDHRAVPDDAQIGAQAVSDCHVCCTLTTCADGDSDAPATYSAPVQFEGALPAQVVRLIEATPLACVAVTVHVATVFPNAPPLSVPTRAPPFQLD